MSKTTKIIAALGVVAGLGVAALPAFTFAVDPTVNGDVQVVVEVSPAIAMKIEGNNDDATAGYSDTYQADTTITTGDDVTGKYEYDSTNHVYVATGDSTAAEGKTYYDKLAAPTIGTAKVASPSGATTLDGQDLVDQGYTIANSPAFAATASSSSWQLLPNSYVFGDRSAQSPANYFGSTITVYTNNTSGYALSVKDADDDTRLVHTGGTYNIPTSGEEVAAGQPRWNFDTTPAQDSSISALAHQAIPAASSTAVTISQTSGKTSSGSTTIVDYNVSTSPDQATGTYTDTIVYTATCNQ